MNGSLSWKAWLGLAAAYLLALDASRGDTISVQEAGTVAKETVTISSSTIGNNVGVYAGSLDIVVNGVTTYGFCVDPWHWSGSGTQTYATATLASAPGNPAPMNAATALQIEQLWAEFFSPTMSNSAAAGLQIAIWDLVGSSVSASTAGSSWFTLNSSNDYGASTDLAWLNSHPTAAAADLIGLTGPGQAYAIDDSLISPVITSTLTASGKLNIPFTYAIDSLGHPTSYSASGLPSGLSVNSSTGVISGTPAVVGTFSVTLGATKGSSTDHVTLRLTIAQTYTLAMAGSPAAGGTWSGAGVYDPGTVVTVAEQPNQNYRTAGWGGSDGSRTASPSSASTTITMSANRSLTAQFVQQARLTVTSGSGGTASGSGVYDLGTVAPISASPSSGYAFTGWSGTGVANAQTSATTVAITGDEIVQASFAQPPVFTATPAQTLVTGQPSSVAVTASSNPTFSASGLPPGLSITSGGVISGTPTAPGTWTGTVTAANAAGSSRESVGFTVYSPPAITSPLTAAGKENEPFTYTITASNAPTGYGASGLPPGLSVNPATGVISGNPTSAGTFPVTVSATNQGATGSATVNLTVGQTYTLAIAASAPGVGTFTGAGVYDAGAVVTVSETAVSGYRASGWSGPDGTATASPTSATTTIVMSANRSLVADFAQQVILTVKADAGGTATGSGVYDVGATVPISAAANTGYAFVGWSGTGVNNLQSAATTVHITGNAIVEAGFAQPPAFTATPPQTLVTGQASSISVTASNSPTFSASSLPPGLSIDPSSGAITGTPTAAGSWSGTITATNIAGSASETVAIAVYDTPVVSSATVGGKLEESLTYSVTASGSPTEYGATGLPAGLSIDPVTGVISGTPAVSGSFPVTVSASNPGATGSGTVTLNVTPTYLLTITGSSDAGGTFTGAGRYDAGTVVTITEAPSSGYRAGGWGGSDSASVASASSASTTITMSADRSLVADFVQQATLTVAAGSGGSATGGGVYDVGTTVTITATPNAQYGFSSWAGGATTNAASATTTVTLNGDESVTANFAALPQPPSATINAAATAYTGSPFTVTSAAAAPDQNLTQHSIEWMSPSGVWSSNTTDASGGSDNRSFGITFDQTGVWTLRAGASVDGGNTWVYSSPVQVTVSNGITTYVMQTMAVPTGSQLTWFTSSPVAQKTYQVKHVNP